MHQAFIHIMRHVFRSGIHQATNHAVVQAHYATHTAFQAHHATTIASQTAKAASGAISLSSVNTVLAAVIAGGNIAKLMDLVLSKEDKPVVNQAIRQMPDSKLHQLIDAISKSAEATTTMVNSTEDCIHNVGHIAALVRGKRL